MTGASPDMAVLIRATQEGGATRSGNVVVPASLEEWVREALDEAIRDNFC